MENNSSIQIINSEKAVATILSNFSTDFIMDVISDNIAMKFRPFNVGPANFSVVLEQQFKLAELENPSFVDDIEDTRAKTHREIIYKICEYYNLTFTGEEFQEYTADQLANLSYILFDIFITNFTPKMVWFFGRYIIDNKDDLYNTIEGADELRKNKEATAYGRRLYTDPKIVVIHNCLNSILSNIAGHDIPFNRLIYYLTDKSTADYLTTIIQDNNDIYKYHYASYINDPLTRPNLFTMVKFQLQSVADKNPTPVSQ